MEGCVERLHHSSTRRVKEACGLVPWVDAFGVPKACLDMRIPADPVIDAEIDALGSFGGVGNKRVVGKRITGQRELFKGRS